jgi:hypothetical protein
MRRRTPDSPPGPGPDTGLATEEDVVGARVRARIPFDPDRSKSQPSNVDLRIRGLNHGKGPSCGWHSHLHRLGLQPPSVGDPVRLHVHGQRTGPCTAPGSTDPGQPIHPVGQFRIDRWAVRGAPHGCSGLHLSSPAPRALVEHSPGRPTAGRVQGGLPALSTRPPPESRTDGKIDDDTPGPTPAEACCEGRWVPCPRPVSDPGTPPTNGRVLPQRHLDQRSSRPVPVQATTIRRPDRPTVRPRPPHVHSWSGHEVPGQFPPERSSNRYSPLVPRRIGNWNPDAGRSSNPLPYSRAERHAHLVHPVIGRLLTDMLYGAGPRRLNRRIPAVQRPRKVRLGLDVSSDVPGSSQQGRPGPLGRTCPGHRAAVLALLPGRSGRHRAPLYWEFTNSRCFT